ncbi:hypothetical protein TrLO_g6985 [Triparma laevis f. longispina]|uniref:Uncharacterized protein n=1 Tax=Triparma laevis f. longispina TaxID=1714387 RepID=A0A9W7FBG9_9STRA|nr:hypothetical protein TrLO_g6985 [Triparma laevis f. longispina]
MIKSVRGQTPQNSDTSTIQYFRQRGSKDECYLKSGTFLYVGMSWGEGELYCVMPMVEVREGMRRGRRLRERLKRDEETLFFKKPETF